MVKLFVVIEMTTKKIAGFFSVENYSNDHQKLYNIKKSTIFEFSQIWFHEHIKRPPAPQKSVLRFELAHTWWILRPVLEILANRKDSCHAL